MTAHVKKPWRKVVRVACAPFHAYWKLKLECGHPALRPRLGRPVQRAPKKIRCWRCAYNKVIDG